MHIPMEKFFLPAIQIPSTPDLSADWTSSLEIKF